MKGEETVALLGFVRALCPAMKMDEYTPDAWHMVLKDLTLADCKDAVVEVAKRETWIAPADIRKEVRRMHTDRLSRVPETAVPDADPDDVKAYQDALRNSRFVVASGLKPRPVRELLAGFGVDPDRYPERAAEVKAEYRKALKGSAEHADVQGDVTDDRDAT